MDEIKWTPFHLETEGFNDWVSTRKMWFDLVKAHGYKWLIKAKRNGSSLAPEFGDIGDKYDSKETLGDWLKNNNVGYIPRLKPEEMTVESYFFNGDMILKYCPKKHFHKLGHFMFWVDVNDLSHLLVVGDRDQHPDLLDILKLAEEFHWKLPDRDPNGAGVYENGMVKSWHKPFCNTETSPELQEIICKALEL
jgi:hypothetical protein